MLYIVRVTQCHYSYKLSLSDPIPACATHLCPLTRCLHRHPTFITFFPFNFCSAPKGKCHILFALAFIALFELMLVGCRQELTLRPNYLLLTFPIFPLICAAATATPDLWPFLLGLAPACHAIAYGLGSNAHKIIFTFFSIIM